MGEEGRELGEVVQSEGNLGEEGRELGEIVQRNEGGEL